MNIKKLKSKIQLTEQQIKVLVGLTQITLKTKIIQIQCKTQIQIKTLTQIKIV